MLASLSSMPNGQSRPISVPTNILTDTRPSPSLTTLAEPMSVPSESISLPQTTWAARLTAAPSINAIAASTHNHSQTNITAIIVLPIVTLGVLSPIFIVWFLSYQRRQKALRKPRHLHEEPKGLKLGQGPQCRWSLNMKKAPRAFRKTCSIIVPTCQSKSPIRRPRSAQHLRAQSLRPSHIQNHSLSGFNFDFSRRVTMFPFHNTEAPGYRHSGISAWSPASQYASGPLTPAQPSFPPQLRTAQLSDFRNADLNAISPLSPEDSNFLEEFENYDPHQETYEPTNTPPALHNHFSEIHIPFTPLTSGPLSAAYLSTHNASNLQHPFSQPATDAASDISESSLDRSSWVCMRQVDLPEHDTEDQRSEISTSELHPGCSVRPHYIV